MGKKKSWFTYVKRLFIPQSKPKSEEKSKNWSWIFEKFKCRQYPALEEPQKTLNDATEEHRKHALAVAVATAAVAEAAMAAANAAAEVVRLTNIPYELERKNHYLSAVKIQSAYRGYLARKALSAMKGIVKLQAVIRGELLRKRFIRKLASISFFVKPKPQVTLLDYFKKGETKGIKSEELKCNSDSGWDLSVVSKEGLESFYLRKQEAIAKRERMKQYSFSHRERRNDQSLQESMTHRKSSRFDQCIELHSKTIAIDTSQLSQLKLRSMSKREAIENLNSSFSLPRRSFCHVKHKSIGDDDESLPNSPVFPAYMAATESAKAKSRSLSTPRQRLRLCDTYSDQNSPYKLRLSTWNSFNGDINNSTKRNSISQQISANLGTFH